MVAHLLFGKACCIDFSGRKNVPWGEGEKIVQPNYPTQRTQCGAVENIIQLLVHHHDSKGKNDRMPLNHARLNGAKRDYLSAMPDVAIQEYI